MLPLNIFFKNKVVLFAATWIDLEIVILSQKEKEKYRMTSLYVESKKKRYK